MFKIVSIVFFPYILNLHWYNISGNHCYTFVVYCNVKSHELEIALLLNPTEELCQGIAHNYAYLTALIAWSSPVWEVRGLILLY